MMCFLFNPDDWLGQPKERYPWLFFHWQVTGCEVS